ncbi:hypothetical protein F5Y13DRAFT_168122 [Hypoxylon sp. FL1857]|nr:hypothetical protein F5Y13DRAFT_168122 [Hypoxylon sp. FL1857]
MYSPGAVAGIAIGCAIASAAIVSAVFLLVHRRLPNLKPVTLSPVPRAEGFLDHLPQGIGHKELRQEFSQLETKIKTFVSNFFHDRPVHVGAVDTDRIHDVLGAADDNSSSQWSTQLCDTAHRGIMLRAYIARVLWARVDSRGEAERSLLPVDVVRCYQAALLRSHPPSLLEYWRAMTVSILAAQYPRDRLAEADPRVDNIKRTVVDLLLVLQPFCTGGAEERSERILEEAVTSFAVLGFKLFSHINTTEIVWPPSSVSQVAVFPALKQYRLGEGQRIVTIKEASLD